MGQRYAPSFHRFVSMERIHLLCVVLSVTSFIFMNIDIPVTVTLRIIILKKLTPQHHSLSLEALVITNCCRPAGTDQASARTSVLDMAGSATLSRSTNDDSPSSAPGTPVNRRSTNQPSAAAGARHTMADACAVLRARLAEVSSGEVRPHDKPSYLIQSHTAPPPPHATKNNSLRSIQTAQSPNSTMVLLPH